MLKTRVLVLRGGPSSEYEVSLKTGQTVLTHIPEHKYHVRDVFIDRQGVWHIRGMPIEPARAFEQADVVFNALHGTYGEDGTVQRLLDTHRVPYTGSAALGSALGMNKSLAKGQLGAATFRLPLHRTLVKAETDDTVLLDVFRTFPQPSVVKPIAGGSSVATSVVHAFDALVRAVAQAFEYTDTVLIEQYIPGREATVGVIEGFRHEALYALPPIEIVPTKNTFFDYDEKYAGHAREVCPAVFPRETTHALLTAAREVHHTLGLRDYSRSDFIVNKHGIFFLEVNTLPGLTSESLVPKALEAVGSSLPEFLDHVLTRAQARR
jgi:D-alanine-D-alanine ligase